MSPKTFDDGVTVDNVVIYSSAATNNRKSALSTKIITSTTGSLIPVVDHDATIEQERINRTNDIRERLGPIMERLMSSVTKIQTLEDSLRLGVGSGGDDDYHNHNHDDTSSTSSKSTNYEHTIIRPGETRSIVNKSMELVKKKMLRLKNMEDKLEALEDRRIILRRHFQLQDKAPMRSQAKSTTDEKSDNLLCQNNRIIELEEEASLMKKKCRLVDDLQARNVQLENDLMDVREALQEKSRTDLQQDGYMHIKRDSLEHKVEYLAASTCDDLKKEKKNLPQTIKNQESQESTVVVVTAPISLTESSIIDKICIVDNNTCNISSMTDESFSLYSTPNGMDGTVEQQRQQHNPRDFSEREDDASSSSSSNSCESSTIENLSQKLKI
jgi:hypothetical protein